MAYPEQGSADETSSPALVVTDPIPAGTVAALAGALVLTGPLGQPSRGSPERSNLGPFYALISRFGCSR